MKDTARCVKQLALGRLVSVTTRVLESNVSKVNYESMNVSRGTAQWGKKRARRQGGRLGRSSEPAGQRERLPRPQDTHSHDKAAWIEGKVTGIVGGGGIGGQVSRTNLQATLEPSSYRG
jgi:hypothetical protein